MPRKKKLLPQDNLERAKRILRLARTSRPSRKGSPSISQAEVAEVCYVSRQSVSLWEAGNLPWEDRRSLLQMVKGYRLLRDEADAFLTLLGQPPLSEEEWREWADVAKGAVSVVADSTGTVAAKRAQSLLVVKAQNYRITHVLLDARELAQLYMVRQEICPNEGEKEFLLHCWLARRGPVWYWLKDLERSRYLSMLISALNEPLEMVRRGAAEAIGQVGAREHISYLLPLLHRDVGTAAKAIVRLNGPENWEFLMELFNRAWRNIDVRHVLAEAMADLATEKQVPQLRSMLKERESGFDNLDRWVAVKALGKLGSRRDLKELLQLLADLQGKEIIPYADTLALSIGTLGTQEDIAILRRIADAAPARDRVFEIACNAIGIIAIREAPHFLWELFQEEVTPFTFNVAQGISMGAASAGTDVSLLEELLSAVRARSINARSIDEVNDLEELEKWLIVGIANVATASQLPLLREKVFEESTKIQLAVARALGRVGNREKDLPLLVELFEGRAMRESVIFAAARAIAQLTTKEDLPLLERLLTKTRYWTTHGPDQATEYLAAAIARLGSDEQLDRLAKTVALAPTILEGVNRALVLLDTKLYFPFPSHGLDRSSAELL